MRAALVYPHQLYYDNQAVASADVVILVEDPLFFSQYAFHRQKLVLHRASMKAYANMLRRTHKVHYVDAGCLSVSCDITKTLRELEIRSVVALDVNDDWLQQRIEKGLTQASVTIDWIEDDHYLTSDAEISKFAGGKSSLYFTNFYIAQRKRLEVLLDGKDTPVGGKWSFDGENRKKLPKGLQPPKLTWFPEHETVVEAKQYVAENFPQAVGSADSFGYPVDRAAALVWLQDFVAQRLVMFGDYEDAISTKEETLYHSVLTPCLNIGLVTPKDILEAVEPYKESVPLNSYEGFIRQIIGWREYMRAVYRLHGRQQRTTNFWRFDRKLPKSFYDGSTGIVPFDNTIQRVLKTGYCHHIERLMVLGNFMLLCRIDPDEVYRWFMELFIDAYDWVMVPNVYAMSQYADGGKITTKPYISGSAYIRKMSDYPRGDWCDVWDALYWCFIDDHQDFLASNPRMKLMTSQLSKMGSKLDDHRRAGQEFLSTLD